MMWINHRRRNRLYHEAIDNDANSQQNHYELLLQLLYVCPIDLLAIAFDHRYLFRMPKALISMAMLSIKLDTVRQRLADNAYIHFAVSADILNVLCLSLYVCFATTWISVGWGLLNPAEDLTACYYWALTTMTTVGYGDVDYPLHI